MDSSCSPQIPCQLINSPQNPLALSIYSPSIHHIHINLLNTTPFMAQNMCANNPPRETFRKFFECWIREQNSYLEELVSAANNYNHNDNDDEALLPLIEKIVRHYEQYYKTKSNWERVDAMSMFSPAWRSKLEDAFLWIGGWRPTLAIHLLYSKSGIQLDAKIGDVIRGLTIGDEDLAELAPSQIEEIDKLQRKTIHEERVLTEKLAKLQESVADRSMVELSNAVSEMIRSENGGEDDQKVESTLESKKDGMEELLHMADDLRLETLKAVISILTPIQAVYFLIAAAELHLRLHEWGKKRDMKAVSAGGTHNLATGLHVA